MRKNEKETFENSPILQAVLRLAIPTVMGQIILVIYNMADTFFIGMTGSDAKLTAATVCMPAFMFLSAVSNLFGIGGSSVISRALGIGDTSTVRKVSSFSAWGCILLTLCYSAFTWIFADLFINWLGGRAPEVHGYARDYLMITVTLGGLATAMSTFLSHLIRSEGRSFQASAGIMLGGVLNIALDPLFMFVLLPSGREIIGAAIATALSNLCALIYFLCTLRRTRSHSFLRFRPTADMLDRAIISDVLCAGLPACLMTLLENVSYAVLDNLMSSFGIACQAGLGVAKKINMLAHCMVRGMSQGVLPLIGYNYAARNYRRMKQSIFCSGGISVLLALLCMAGCLIFAEPLVSIFILDANVASIDSGARFLRILCLGGPFSACAYAIISFFQATGKGLKSFFLAILRKGVLDIPMMFILGRFIPMTGIVMATPITDLICSVAAVGLFTAFLRAHREEKIPAVDGSAPQGAAAPAPASLRRSHSKSPFAFLQRGSRQPENTTAWHVL